MKYSLIFFASGLLFFGAGCASSDTVPLPAPIVPSAIPAPEPTSTTTQPSSTDSTLTPSTQPTSTAQLTPMPLAFPGILPTSETSVNVRVKTTLGDIVIQLTPDQGPKAASNFVYLVKQHFYDGLIFHRVIDGFMIQGGDPTGTGMSGPGYKFEDDPVKLPYTDGIVAMANSGANTNGSQFFIMVTNMPTGAMAPAYSIFGKVTEGLDIAHKIAVVPKDQNDHPLTDVKMVSVTIEK